MLPGFHRPPPLPPQPSLCYLLTPFSSATLAACMLLLLLQVAADTGLPFVTAPNKFEALAAHDSECLCVVCL